jgi:multidrug resistance efflux pump
MASVGRWLVVLAILVAGVIGMGQLAALRKPPERANVEGYLPLVRTATPAVTEYRERLDGYGRARALRSVDVLAEVAGVVAWTAPELEAGAAVTAGTVLARIDARDFELVRDQAESARKQAVAELARIRAELQGLAEQLTVARTALDSSRRELERAEELAKNDLATANEVDVLRRAYDFQQRQVVELQALERSTQPRVDWVESDIARLEALVAKAKLDLGRTEIAAPFAGRIVSRNAELGQRVAPGIMLFDLVDLTRVEVPVSLPGSRFGEIAIGARAEIRLREGGDVVWTGEVKRIAPAIDPTNRTFDVYLEVSGDAHATVVAPGAFVLATIDGRLHAGVRAVPRGAFVDGALFLARPIAGDPNLAIIEAVTPSIRRALVDVSLIDSGLADGDRVVVTNLERIAPGSKVRLESASSGAAK